MEPPPPRPPPGLTCQMEIALVDEDSALGKGRSASAVAGNNRELVTEEWISQFVHIRTGGSLADGEQMGVNLLVDTDLAQNVYDKFRAHGVFYKDQVKELALNDNLHDTLECVGVADAITEYFDREVAENRKKTKLKSFLTSLAGSLDAMESMCVNYGIASALILTMTFGNFASVGPDDWQHYLTLELQEQTCQQLAQGVCSADLLEWDNLYWGSNYCFSALFKIFDNPLVNLTNTPDECCLAVIDCAKWKQWYMEFAFTIGNGGGATALLLSVLFTSWLYIALSASKANKVRYEEAKLVTIALQKDFLALHFLFLSGVILSIIGIICVMSIKVSTLNLSYLVWFIGLIGGALTLYILVRSLAEIHKINAAIDTMRDANHNDRISFVGRIASASIASASLGATVHRA